MNILAHLQDALGDSSDVTLTWTSGDMTVHGIFILGGWSVAIFDNFTKTASGICNFTVEEMAAISGLALFGEYGIAPIESQRGIAENAMRREGIIDEPFRLIP